MLLFHQVGTFINEQLTLNTVSIEMYDATRQFRLSSLPTSVCPTEGCLYCIIPRDMVDFYYTPGMSVCTALYPEIWWTSIIHQVCLSVLHYTQRYGGLLLYTRYVCLYCIIPRDMVDFYYTPGMSVCTALYPEIWWTSIIHQVCLSVLHYTQRYGGLLLSEMKIFRRSADFRRFEIDFGHC